MEYSGSGIAQPNYIQPNRAQPNRAQLNQSLLFRVSLAI